MGSYARSEHKDVETAELLDCEVYERLAVCLLRGLSHHKRDILVAELARADLD